MKERKKTSPAEAKHGGLVGSTAVLAKRIRSEADWLGSNLNRIHEENSFREIAVTPQWAEKCENILADLLDAETTLTGLTEIFRESLTGEIQSAKDSYKLERENSAR